ncbi:hypothetical protein GCM10009863_36080 [Streptomyces axinellae]|uniref:NADP-dependent oxidoreductase domain-containing protein n=1 Tax=Streptomyces axinellae TaxID=552788 RepID=A0ABN3Q763_9ACTN
MLLQQEGEIRHIGLSEVTVEQVKQARKPAETVSVQNLYNLTNRGAEDVLEYAERENLAFIPWFPIATGEPARPGGPPDAPAREHSASPSQLALAWLLRRSPVMLPIPDTSRVAHPEENTEAARITLGDEEFQAPADAVWTRRGPGRAPPESRAVRAAVGPRPRPCAGYRQPAHGRLMSGLWITLRPPAAPARPSSRPPPRPSPRRDPHPSWRPSSRPLWRSSSPGAACRGPAAAGVRRGS